MVCIRPSSVHKLPAVLMSCGYCYHLYVNDSQLYSAAALFKISGLGEGTAEISECLFAQNFKSDMIRPQT